MVVGQVADIDVEVRADDAPRRFVILVGELAAIRAQIFQRRRHAPRAGRLAVVVVEPREVVPALPSLDEHVPVGHLDRRDRDVRLQRDRRNPVERHGDLLRREERTIARMDAVDRQVLDEHFSGEQDFLRLNVGDCRDFLLAFHDQRALLVG